MIANIFREEVRSLFKHWPVWFLLGTQDIKLRYRRSSIGPLWITLSTTITVGCMGFIYGHLFHMNLAIYFPFLASGMICWGFISTLINEASVAFISSENYLKNQETYIFLFLMRLLLRNTIIYLHNLLMFVAIIFIFNIGIGWNILMLIPGLMLIAINTILWGNILAIVGTRYRDLTQIIMSLTQVVFFITPVMWMPNALPQELQWIVTANPFFYFLNLLRNPLLNQNFDWQGLPIIMGVTFIGFILSYFFLKRYRNRIVFWL